jgi:beta-lactamase superfamily II metal-dependent hydrolase
MDIGILSLNVLHPDILLPHAPGHVAENQDNNSIVLRLRYGNIAFLFTGDARKQAEESILKAGLEVHADILKVCRHGAITSSSPQFLNAVSPKVAVWIAGIRPAGAKGKKGAGAQEKKPDPITISALKNVGAKVYGTKTHGTAILGEN